MTPLRWLTLLGLVVASGLGLAGLVTLYCFNPLEYAFYPRCWFQVWTGWWCPGCGGLRALHALLHGQFAQAIHYNALVIVAIALGLVTTPCWLRQIRRRSNWLSYVLSLNPALGWYLIGAMTGFGLLRNLPFAPFSWFCP